MSSFDPWSGLVFEAAPSPPLSSAPSTPQPRTALAQALAAQDPMALAAALATPPGKTARPAELSRQLCQWFSPACAQVLFDASRLPARATFDLAVERADPKHLAWWLSDATRVGRLFADTFSRPRGNESASWLVLRLEDWAKHNPELLVEVGQSIDWPAVLKHYRASGPSRFPWPLLRPALYSGVVPMERVRTVLERACSDAFVISLANAPAAKTHVEDARAAVGAPLREEFLHATLAQATQLQALITSSPVLSQAWTQYWRHPDMASYRRFNLTMNLDDGRYTPRPQLSSSSFLEDQLLSASPALVEGLLAEDRRRATPMLDTVLPVLASRPNVLACFLNHLNDTGARRLLPRLFDDLAHVKFDRHNLAQLILACHPTLPMLNLLARHPVMAQQLSVRMPHGRMPAEYLADRLSATSSQRQRIDLALVRGAKLRLEQVAQSEQKQVPARRPRAL